MARTASAQPEANDIVLRRIRAATDHRERENRLYTSEWRDRFNRNLSYYYGFQRPDYFEPASETDPPYVITNVLKPNVQIIVEAMLQSRTKVLCEAYSPEFLPQKALIPIVGNWLWRQQKDEVLLEPWLREWILYGYGVCRVGWEYRTEKNERLMRRLEAELDLLPGGAFISQAEGTVVHIATDPDTGEEVRTEIVNPSGEALEVATVDRMFTDHIPAVDFWVDPRCTDMMELTNTRYVVWREYRSVEEIEDSDKWKADGPLTEVSMPNYLQPYSDAGARGTDEAEVEDVVPIFHYLGEDPEDSSKWLYEVRANEDHGVILRSVEWEDHYYPFAIAAFPTDPGITYPISPFDDCISDQDILNQTMTSIAEHVKAWDQVLVAFKDSFNNRDNPSELRNARNGSIITINRRMAQNDIRSEIFPLPNPRLQPEVYQALLRAENNIRLKLGVTEFQQGVFPQVKQTATSVMELSQRADVRAKGLAKRFARVKGTLMTLQLRTFLDNADRTTTFYVPVLNDMQEQAFKEFTIDLIDGRYVLEVEMIDMPLASPNAEAMKWNSLLQILLPFSQGGVDPRTGQPAGIVNPVTNQPYIHNLWELLEKVIYGFGLENPETLRGMPPLTEMEQQQLLQQQQQQQMMQMMQQMQGAQPVTGGNGAAPPMPEGVANGPIG